MTSAQRKQREIFMYFIFGGLTTLVNLISFFLFDITFSSQEVPVNLFQFRIDLLDVLNTTIAWILAVLFAFVTNRSIVFRSKGPFFKEMLSFFSSRIFTLVIFEIGFLELGILIVENVIGQDKNTAFLMIGAFSFTYLYVIKILIAVFVVIGNYILSKIFVFRQAKQYQESVAEQETLSDRKEP